MLKIPAEYESDIDRQYSASIYRLFCPLFDITVSAAARAENFGG
jgi:hypothetical protein